MHELLLTHWPIVGTCGVIALLAGPLARLPINLGGLAPGVVVPSHPDRRSQTDRFLHDSVNQVVSRIYCSNASPVKPKISVRLRRLLYY